MAVTPVETSALTEEALRDMDATLDRDHRLIELACLLNSALELAALLPAAVRLAAELTGAEAGAVGLVGPEAESISYPYAYNLPVAADGLSEARGQGPAWPVVENGQALLLPDYVADPGAQAQWVTAGARAGLIAPIAAGEARLGVLLLFYLSAGKAFQSRDLRLAEAVGRQAGAAIQSAERFAVLRERTVEYEAQTALSRALRSADSQTTMLAIILDQVAEALGAGSALLLLKNAGSDDAEVELGRGIWQAASGDPLRGRPAFDQVVTTGQPLTVAGSPGIAEVLALDPSQALLALACVPLIAHGETLGALCAARSTGDPTSQPFSPAEVRLLGSIGDTVANALQRAALHEHTRRRLQRLTALRDIEAAITSSLDLNETLSVVLHHVIRELGVHAADVLLLNAAAGTLDYAAAIGFQTEALQHTRLPLGQGNAGRAALERRVVYIPDLSAEGGDFARAPLLARENFVAYYALPLLAKGHVRGVLEVFYRAPLKPDDESLEFMEALAAEAAIALDNAVLFQDLQRSLEAQRAAQGQLVRVARLTAVGELAAGVAHQINNPLTTIIADAQLLQRSLGPEHPGTASANAIYQAGWRAQRVIQRLLNFSRPEEGQLIPTDINDTIVAALDLVSAHIERGGVDLHVGLAPDLPPIPASDRQLEEIWINLLLNARDAMVEGRPGIISIASRLAEDGQAVEILVADNGCGMDEAAQAGAFTPFFTTKEPGRGNGLGLSVCQSIAQNHGGAITFESQVGKGTSFLIRLPLVA